MRYITRSQATTSGVLVFELNGGNRQFCVMRRRVLCNLNNCRLDECNFFYCIG